MIDHYPARVRANILPLSRAQSLPAAFTEWHWTGIAEDHEQATEQCELCDKESLRYHFEIANDETGHRLQVGSSCILKWQVGVFENGSRLDKEAAKARLDAEVRKVQRTACLKALATVAAADPSPILESVLHAYEADVALTPKQLNVALWRLQNAGIPFNTEYFKVDMRKQKRLADLKAMRQFEVDRLWPALSSAQKGRAIKAGIKAPAKADNSQ